MSYLITNDYYGVDVEALLRDYVNNEFTPMYQTKYEASGGFAGFIAEASALSQMHFDAGPFDIGVPSFHFWTDDGDRDPSNWRTEELLLNVVGKGRFSQRTGLDSIEALKPGNAHMLRPGDFPYGGFVVNYRGWCGGGSGTKQESDVTLFMGLIDHLCDSIMGPIAREVEAVITWTRNTGHNVGDWKFMDGDPETFVAFARERELSGAGIAWEHTYPKQREAVYAELNNGDRYGNSAARIGPDGMPNVAVTDGITGKPLSPREVAERRARSAVADREGSSNPPRIVN